MNRPQTLRRIQRLARSIARRTAILATQSQFTAEEILADVAIEARCLLMRKRWGPPGQHAKKRATPPHHAKKQNEGDTA